MKSTYRYPKEEDQEVVNISVTSLWWKVPSENTGEPTDSVVIS